MEGSWGHFIEALNERAQAIRKERELEEANKEETEVSAEGAEPVDKPENEAGEASSSTADSSEEDPESASSEEDPKSDSEDESVSLNEEADGFKGIDINALKGSAKSFESKIHKRLITAAEEAAEVHEKVHKRRKLLIRRKLNVRNKRPSPVGEDKFENAAFRGVIAFFGA